MKHNKCGLAFDAAICELSRVTGLGGNYTEILWRQTLLEHFRMTITTFQNKISPLVSQVMPSHSAKSHAVFERSCGIYSLNAFPSPIWHFHHSFLMRYFRMRIKRGWWEHRLAYVWDMADQTHYCLSYGTIFLLSWSGHTVFRRQTEKWLKK